MSTRLRLIYRQPGVFFTGRYAVVKLVHGASAKGIFNLDLPEGWKKLSKVEKCKFLAGQLPEGHALELYREPRGLRKSRSAYWAAKVVKPVPVIPQKPAGNIFFDLEAVRQPQAPQAPGWIVERVQEAQRAHVPPNQGPIFVDEGPFIPGGAQLEEQIQLEERHFDEPHDDYIPEGQEEGF